MKMACRHLGFKSLSFPLSPLRFYSVTFLLVFPPDVCFLHCYRCVRSNMPCFFSMILTFTYALMSLCSPLPTSVLLGSLVFLVMPTLLPLQPLQSTYTTSLLLSKCTAPRFLIPSQPDFGRTPIPRRRLLLARA